MCFRFEQVIIVCIPQVELPLGATEDRVCGTIDVERALSEGVRAFEPGLLVRSGFASEES